MTLRLCLSGSILALLVSHPAWAEEVTPLDPIRVTAKGEIAASGEAGSAAIDAESIQSRAPGDFRSLFRNDAAVTVGGGGAASQKVILHGFEESKLGVTIDGARQPGNIWHHNGSTTIDPSLMGRVEVEPGVTAADAGFAIGAGAVRYRTLGVNDLLEEGASRGARLRLAYGSNGNAAQGSVSAYGRSNGFEYLGAFTRSWGNAYKAGDGEVQRGTKPALTGGLAKLAYEGTEGDRFELSNDYARDSADRLLRLNMDQNGTALFNRHKTTRNTTTLRYTRTTEDRFYNPEVELYNTIAKLDRPYGAYRHPVTGNPLPNGDFRSDASYRGGKVQNTFNLDNGSIVAGIDFYKRSIDIERLYARSVGNLPMAPVATESAWGAGFYTQGRFDLTERLHLSTGLRFDGQNFSAVDRQEFDNYGFSPNATLRYDLGSGVGVFAGAGKSWLGLEQGETALYHARDFFYSSSVEPAYAENYKVGVTYEGEAFSGSVTLFDSNIYDSIQYDYTSRPGYGFRRNSDRLRSTGVDVALNYAWDHGQAGVRISHSNTRIGKTGASPDLYVFVPTGTVATVFADHRFEEYGLTLGGSVNLAAKYDRADFLAAGFRPMDSYAVFNIYGEWTPEFQDNLTVRLEVNNLFDKAFVERGTYPSSTTVDAVKAPGRSFMLSAQLKF